MSLIASIRAAINATEENSKPSSSSLPRLLFSEDLSKFTGLSLTTIRHYTGNPEKFGHLIPRWFKLPGARRLAWLESDVVDWLKAGQSSAPAAKRRRGRPTKAEQVRRNIAAG